LGLPSGEDLDKVVAERPSYPWAEVVEAVADATGDDSEPNVEPDVAPDVDDRVKMEMEGEGVPF